MQISLIDWIYTRKAVEVKEVSEKKLHWRLTKINEIFTFEVVSNKLLPEGDE